MNFSSFIIELLVVGAMIAIVVGMWRTGKRENLRRERGWSLILGGFCLLFFGALVDLSDHFPDLSRFIILGRTPYQAVAEKLVGFLGGYTLLAVGFWRWLPHITERRLVERQLRETTQELEHRVRKGSAELSLKNMDLEREIRQRRVATSELRRSRELLEKVVESAPIALLACDVEGEVSLAKGRALMAVGFDSDSGESVSLFARYPELSDNLKQALAGESSTSTLTIGQRTFEFLHTPWSSENDELLGVVTIGTDVTELHQVSKALRVAKEAAEEANRSKSRFLANMSHELRTPLNSVIGFANVLSKNKDQRLDDKDLRYLDRIHDNGQHLLALINEILDLSRIESGSIELEWTEVELTALVRDTVTQLSSQNEDDVPIRWQLPDTPISIRADAVKLRQVLLNLLGNAVKFTREGHVDVRLQLDDEGQPSRLEVQDTGPGVSAADLKMIFEPFQQVEGTTTREHGGSGLGLSISRSLCQQMRFFLGVDSQVDVGSTFWIDFRPHDNDTGPLLAAYGEGGAVARGEGEAKSASDHGTILQSLKGCDVLLIDDSSESRHLMVDMLTELGCRTRTAVSGEDGLAQARQRRPDMIILDLLMPQMDGWQVLANLKNSKDLASIPVLVASMVADERRGSLLGELEVLNKPISRGQLETVLSRMLIREPARVLVVDDEEMIRHLLSELLGRRGYRVTTAAGGEEALSILEGQPHDLLIVDLIMPGMDGRGLITALRADPRWRDMPVVVVTGMSLTGDERKALEERVDGILPKGFDLEDELRRLVEELTSR